MEPSIVRTLDRINGTQVTSANAMGDAAGESRGKAEPAVDPVPRIAPPAARLEVRR
jgi:hypothetical protein